MKIIPFKIESQDEAKKLMFKLGVSREGIKILSPKAVYLGFKIEGIKSWEANIIKQHLLSLGSDAAVERSALVKDIETAAFVFGNLSQLEKFCQKLKNQPFNLKEISRSISFYLDSLHKKEFVFHARDKRLKIKKPLICGIINITDDSFSGDGLLSKAANSFSKIKKTALRKCEQMIKDGAEIIDIGGASSRPFSRQIKDTEEIKRVIPILGAIRKRFRKVPISVDTHKYIVAKKAVDEGVDIVNDITALRGDLRMASLIKKHKLGCVLMHMKGTPKTMQINPSYKDVVEEELSFFKERLNFCSEQKIRNEQIFIDPGIGFGKRTGDNTKIINELYKFKIFGLPIFLGLSRKSFIGKVLNVEAENRLTGTITASVISLIRGANVLRVHDVSQTAQAMKIASKILNN